MTPFDQAAQLYERFSCTATFAEHLEWYLQHGYVFSTPQLFLMGRPVELSSFHHEKLLQHDPAHCDCWYVHLFAGDLSSWTWPYPLPYLAWHRMKDASRGRQLRVYPAERIVSCTHANPSPTPSTQLVWR
jgi:hypothetical protein